MESGSREVELRGCCLGVEKARSTITSSQVGTSAIRQFEYRLGMRAEMIRTPVTSTDIASVGYDESTLTLEIEFVTGSIYQYFDVPSTVHSNLMSASSHGKFFHAEIRGKFRYAKM